MILLLISFLLVSAQKPTDIPVFTEEGNVGTLNPFTGDIDCLMPLPLPKPSPDCYWYYADGIQGQTAATFAENSTYFFTGQEICENNTVGNVVLFQVMGPYPGQDCYPPRVFVMAVLPTDVLLENINIAWDHTCNIVALYPIFQSNATLYATLQISEYDGQERPRPYYSIFPTKTESCWSKVNGFGALDFGDGHGSWPFGQELNCGPTCIFYTLEQCVIDNRVQRPPRALIGKYYRSGELVHNITDSVQIKSMSYVSFYGPQQFLGIGECCTEPWCHSECQGLDGHLVLVKFNPSNQEFSVLADIGIVEDPSLLKLGVEYSSTRQSTRQAFIYYQNRVIAYNLVFDNNNQIIGAKESSRSEPTKQKLKLWGHDRF